MDFAKEYKEYREAFEVCLAEMAADIRSPSKQLLEAVRYALLGGGKRLRPVLFLAVFTHFSKNTHGLGEAGRWSESVVDSEKNKLYSSVCGKSDAYLLNGICSENAVNTSRFLEKEAGYLACAIECLHTYTLVHDDLPCLDDDDFRRGRPSCHKKFGEAIALLAGDSLLNLCYELLFKATVLNPSIAVGAFDFAAMLGIEGLVGGQAVELCLNRHESFSAELDCVAKADMEQMLLEICKNKTAVLFVASVVLAGRAAGCDDTQLSLLKDFAENFGFAFQLKDDLSDMNVGSYAHAFGKEKTENLVEKYSAAARTAAKALGSQFLECFIDFEKYI